MEKELRLIASFILLILLGVNTLFSHSIDIISSLKIKIPPASGHFYETFWPPPIYVFQGHKGEILIWRGAFFAVYSSEGKFLKNMGGEGEGPGEFFVIVDFRKAEDRYYLYEEVVSSGDMIAKLYNYKEHILVSVTRGDADKFSVYLFLLDPTLKTEIGPLNLKDYLFCGADKNYIYFAQYIKEPLSARDEAEIELLKCSLKF